MTQVAIKGEQLWQAVIGHVEAGRWDAMLAAAKELHAHETNPATRVARVCDAVGHAMTLTPSDVLIRASAFRADVLAANPWMTEAEVDYAVGEQIAANHIVVEGIDLISFNI